MKYLGKIQDNKDLVTKEYVDNADSGKVDKVSGKGLSTNDYTTAEKNKLAGIAAGAQVNSVTGVKGNSESSYRTGNVNLTAANVGAVAKSDELLTTDPFAPASLRGPYISKIDNAFYAADKRWTITATNYEGNVSSLFDGNYETMLQIRNGNTSVITMNFSNTTYFPGYPYGYILISFYHVCKPSSISCRVYCNYSAHGIGWHNISFSPMSDNTSSNITYRSAHQGYYQISQIEITIVGDTTNSYGYTGVNQIEMHLDRPDSSKNPFLSKYGAETLYYNLTAPKFIGALQGNADTATTAEKIPLNVLTGDTIDGFRGNYFRQGRVTSYPNVGLASNDGIVLWIPFSDSYGRQLLFEDNGSLIKERYYNNGTWSSWAKLAAGSADTATNASKVNNLTVQTAVPANAVFTDTVTTATTSGSGNAVTSVTASNGALTVTKGTTFLTSHQDISGKADKSATVSTVTWDSTNKKLTKTINGTTTDVVTAATLRTGLNVADGAEVNQNAFSNVKVGSTTVAADSKTDTLELVAGSNVTLTPDATNDKVTIAATDTTYESKAAASGGTAVSLVTTGEKYTWNHKMSSIADVTNMELLTYEGLTNDVMTVGLHDDVATSKVPVVNATTGKIPASVYVNTTYESKEAASGGTAVSLVTTGEKYTWNNKQATLVSGTNIKTINNTSLLGSGNISVGGSGTTDYSDLSNKPQINSTTLSGNKTSADLGLQSALSVESQTLTVSSNFSLYTTSPYTTTDATIKLRRYGKVVSVTGMVKPKTAIAGSDTEYTICTVPSGYRPTQCLVQVMHGSTQYHWCLKVNTNGNVTFSRYSASTSYAQASTSAWLPFHATWIID